MTTPLPTKLESSPAMAALIWRIGAFIGLTILWLSGSSEAAGLMLILALAVLALARWRMPLPPGTLLADQLLCLVAAALAWPGAWFSLALPLFETALRRAYIYAVPIVLLFAVYAPASPLLWAVMLQAAFVGWAIGQWSAQLERYRREADQERRERYELERLKEGWQLANIRAARLAELSERTRMAHKLHDHVGHEIAAAMLAMQAFERLWQENDPRAAELFRQAQQRLDNSALQLRETVLDMTPVELTGVDRLQDICQQFAALSIRLQVYGDSGKVPVHLWTVLEPCLKEALTNAARHSNASHVEVTLDISSAIVRLSVQDNGTAASEGENPPGTGLRNLRRRAQAVGGTVTAHWDNGFQLICVLPLGEEII
ncbi:sensor histidine kinase [Paenibacillus senegalensis]|uniref:sensor histidine kinase n=1 Tax=Paenibacillus senegalensis TaxID=1465766 RepID=UPI000287BBD4|nr:sensor histidine kinase [Paenibacillus senegalensis]